jgi:hypothetical protein
MSKTRHGDTLQAARSFRAPRQLTDDAIFNFLSSLDTPRSLAVWLLYSVGEHDQLVNLDIDINWYLNGYRFRLDYAATSFLSKACFLKTSFKKEEVAFKKFESFELLCNQTNERFKSPLSDPLYNGPNVWLLHATKRKIEEVLGDFDGEEWVNKANWGPGVSTTISGPEVSGYNKFHGDRGITRDLYSLISPWFGEAYPLWADHLSREYGESWAVFEVGNRIVTVPKNSKTDRVIAIEPAINLYLQKGIGSMIRDRLARFGIDLNDQTKNQDLAQRASLDGSLATIDFSSASDSISLEVVRELLPPRWFQLLDSCRSKYGQRPDGSSLRWGKFSSMGNGYTFELESLIFFAAASAVRELKQADGPISVFGDDVLLPSICTPLFTSFSKFLGFIVNEQKSFSSGPFRESCGSYYWGGVDCKPIFLKERLSNAQTIFKLANSVRLLAHRYRNYSSCDASFLNCWTHLYHGVPRALQLKVPRDAGDTGFIVNFDEASPARARNGIEGFYYGAIVNVGSKRPAEGRALTLASLRRLGLSYDRMVYATRQVTCLVNSRTLRHLSMRPDIDSEGNYFTLRGVTRLLFVRPLCRRWYNLGEWH